jgi:hypothetical protein
MLPLNGNQLFISSNVLQVFGFDTACVRYEKTDTFKKEDYAVRFSRKGSKFFENKCRTEKINSALLLMLAADKGFRAKKRTTFKNPKLSG